MRQQEGVATPQTIATKEQTNIRSLCRAYTDESVRHLAAIMRQPEFPPSARVQAAVALLDRGWGRPAQAHTGENGEGDIRVTIRQIVDGGNIDRKQTRQIEAVPVVPYEAETESELDRG